MIERDELQEIIEPSKEIVKTAGFIELSERLGSLYEEFDKLIQENKKLKQQNKNLQHQIPSEDYRNDNIEEIIKTSGPPEACYDTEDETTLFCPSCWENSKFLIKLVITPPQTTSIGKYRCPKCRKSFGERKA
jgi:ethanolamine utilization protein EutA (predicted chaperonin)